MAEKAFQPLKSAMMSVPVLGFPDFTESFVWKLMLRVWVFGLS